MKKITLMLLGIVFLFAAACDKDDDEPEKTRRDMLVGEWVETKTSTKITPVNPPFPVGTLETDTVKLVTRANFMSSGAVSFTYRENGQNKEGISVWTLTENDQKIVIPVNITSNGQTVQTLDFEIRSLTDTKLTVYNKMRREVQFQGLKLNVDFELITDFAKK